MTPRGPRNWSVSAARLYLNCPMAFKMKYIDKVKVPHTERPDHWKLGTVCHAGLEAAYKQRKKERAVGPMMTDSTWEAAKAAIASEWESEGLPPHEQSDGMWDRVHLMVQKTLEDQEEAWEDIYAVERKLFVQAGMNIIGFADLMLQRLPGVVRIRDWKSRSKLPTTDELKKDFQGRLYAGMVYRLDPEVDEIEFSHYMPPVAEEVVVHITREEGEEAISRLRSVRDMVHNEKEWATNKSDECGYCVFKPQCPAWASEREAEELQASIDKF